MEMFLERIYKKINMGCSYSVYIRGLAWDVRGPADRSRRLCMFDAIQEKKRCLEKVLADALEKVFV